MKHANSKTSCIRMFALCLAVLLGVTLQAKADEVQTSNYWVPNLTIQYVIKGELVYLTNQGSEVTIALDKVQGIKVPASPTFWEAQQLITQGKDAEAMALLTPLQLEARQPWLKNHTLWLTAHVQDRLGHSKPALEAYLQLAKLKADDFYLKRPPMVSFPKASAQQKKELGELLTPAIAEYEGVAKAALLEIARLLGDAAALVPPTDGGPTQPGTIITPGIIDTNKKLTNETGVIFTTYLAGAEQDPVLPLLYAGQWQQAVDKCNELLKGQEMRMSMRLYQLGMAQLQLAQASGVESQYKDAGLSLSRCVIYFPSSSVTGPALVELGYIHLKIGRQDLALKLWDKARLQVDETQDPEVYARLEKLIAQQAASAVDPVPASTTPETTEASE